MGHMDKEKAVFEQLTLSSFAYLWVNSTDYSGEFHVAFKHFQNHKNCLLLSLWDYFSLKPYKTFRIPQYIFKSSGTIGTIGYY